MIKNILFVFGALIVSNNATAQQQVTLEEAKNAARQFASITLNKRTAGREPVVENVYSLKRESHTLMYEVIFDDRQGVLLSGSKACLPVLGYYDVPARGRSIFDDDVSCCLKFMLGEYEIQYSNA